MSFDIDVVGGPLALVRDGDLIRIDVPARRLDLLVSPDELEGRRAALRMPPAPERGWRRLHATTVMQPTRVPTLTSWRCDD